MLLAGRPLWIKQVMSEYEISKGEKKFVEQYLALIDEFDNETQLEYYKKEDIINVINSVIDGDNTIHFHLLKDGIPIGFISGIITSHIYDSSQKVLMEFGWFITKEERKTLWSVRLLKTFEKAGKEAGANSVFMILRTNLTDTKVEDFYLRSGYTLVEKSFCKRL